MLGGVFLIPSVVASPQTRAPLELGNTRPGNTFNLFDSNVFVFYVNTFDSYDV